MEKKPLKKSTMKKTKRRGGVIPDYVQAGEECMLQIRKSRFSSNVTVNRHQISVSQT